MENYDKINELLEQTTDEEKEKIYRIATLIAQQIYKEEKARKKARKKAKKAKNGKDGKSGESRIVYAGGGNATASASCSVNIYDGVSVNKTKSTRTNTVAPRESSPEVDVMTDVLRVAKTLGNVFSLFA